MIIIKNNFFKYKNLLFLYKTKIEIILLINYLN